jgi:hypothetical protein
MIDEPTLFIVQVWRQGGFRAAVRAVDETEPHWFSATEPLVRHLAQATVQAHSPGESSPSTDGAASGSGEC